MSNFQEKSNFIWNIADLIRDNFDKNDFQKIILPFTVLKRFDCVLAHSKEDVVKNYNEFHEKMDKNAMNSFLLNVAVDEDGNPLGFYNHSPYDFEKLLEDPSAIKDNMDFYIDSFSDNIKDILKHFEIKSWINKLYEKKLLYKLIKKFSETDVDLSPNKVSNHEMGTIFEELIRRFSEASNEESGEHFTPRDVVKLMTELMFVEDDLEEEGSIKTVYDPACGTGGMLTSCEEFINKKDEEIKVLLYGQEINDRIYAICKSDMLLKGDESENIKGPTSTLSNDQLKGKTFDYIISNPPYGKKWELDKEAVMAEAELGYSGRFGAGTPGIDDGQLLFIQHMISKMHPDKKSRIAVITNGSPLFKGDITNSLNETTIRKWIFENDYLEALIALPDQLFFNTGIGTYIWILTNEKSPERINKVQMIDARQEFGKMRKSLGDKRNIITNVSIKKIIELYHSFEEGEQVKIFDTEDFGYTKITVERPQQYNYQVTEERLLNLYSYNQFKKLAESKSKDEEVKEREEAEGKQKQEDIKDALRTIPDKKYTNWNEFEVEVKKVLEPFNLKPKFIENIIKKLAEHDDTADYVTDRRKKVKADTELRDYEKIPLKKDIDEYFEEEVLKYYPDAWISDREKVGYEVNFTQYFYVYEPPRPLEEIEADIKKVTAEIQELLEERVL